MKIRMLKSLLYSFGVVFLFGCSDPNLSSDDNPVNGTLFINGAFYTQNSQNPQANAMLIADGRIMAIGERDAITPAMSQVHRVVDLNGATVLPGIIDSHAHVRQLGAEAIKANLVGVKNIAEIVVRMQTKYPNPKAGEWLIGQGWDEGYFGSVGYPDRRALDIAFPNNPVALESLHGFAGMYNGAALKIANITANTPQPDVGDILKRDDGTPTGVMLTLAQGLVKQHVPPLSQGQREEAIRTGLLTMGAQGVTSVHEAGMSAADVKAFQNLHKKNALPIRVYGMLDGNDDDLMSGWFERGVFDDENDYFDVKSIKVFYDGSLGSRTALLRKSYSDKPESARPTERITPEAVSGLAKRAAQTGFQMAVHAIGDEGNDRIMTLYENSLKQNPDVDHRWRIEHAQIVLPDFYKRMATLGVIASMQSSHAVGDSGWAEDRVGASRIQHGYAWQNMLRDNVKLMMNSDLPGEPWTPMETLYFAVTRMHLDGDTSWYPEQALSVDEAIVAMTKTGAYGAFQEDMLGSLEVGKWADFIVLDKNPYTVSPREIKNIKVQQTWVAGEKLEISQ